MTCFFALVGGWGAVEKTAAKWQDGSEAVEVEPRLWHVRHGNRVIGVVGKAPWTIEELRRRAATLEAALFEDVCNRPSP